MAVTFENLQETVDRLSKEHDHQLLRGVSTHALCSSLLDAYARRHLMSLDKQIEMLDRIVTFYVTNNNMSMLSSNASSRPLIATSRQL